MDTRTAKSLKIPKGMPITRYADKKRVNVPDKGEAPLIDEKHPVEERWIARIRVFNLNDETELGDYERVWQLVCDGRAKMCEHRTEFENGKFVAMLRWSEFEYKLPDT